MCGRYVLTIDKSAIENHFSTKFKVERLAMTGHQRIRRSCCPSSAAKQPTISDWLARASGQKSANAADA